VPESEELGGVGILYSKLAFSLIKARIGLAIAPFPRLPHRSSGSKGAIIALLKRLHQGDRHLVGCFANAPRSLLGSNLNVKMVRLLDNHTPYTA